VQQATTQEPYIAKNYTLCIWQFGQDIKKINLKCGEILNQEVRKDITVCAKETILTWKQMRTQ